MELAKRKINYFELTPTLKDNDVDNVDFIQIFTHITKLTKDKDKGRYVHLNERVIFITDIKFNAADKQISGKIYNIRMDIFPELINTENDKVRDIDADKEEGIVETTHFLLSYAKKSLALAYEYNHYGPRISDFVYYVNFFGTSQNICDECDYMPYTRDDLDNYKNRMHRVSYFLAKVHKDNVNRVKSIDKDLFSAIDTASSISDAEYVTLSLKYDYAKIKGTSKIKEITKRLIEKLTSDKKNVNVFDTLKVKAEDGNNHDKLKEFDLLNIWVQSEVKVEKREKSRAILSTDMLPKMIKELRKEFGR